MNRQSEEGWRKMVGNKIPAQLSMFIFPTHFKDKYILTDKLKPTEIFISIIKLESILFCSSRMNALNFRYFASLNSTLRDRVEVS